MKQQDQTRHYFKSAARPWNELFSRAAYSTAEGRHRAVMATIASMPGARQFLDVGCGTGQLAIEATQKGLAATGIDFADEMIATSDENARVAGVTPRFICRSIFEFSAPAGSYDIVSAQGFIEYISLEQLEAFFAMARDLLSPGGALVVGSRNRLFNIVSLNQFTTLERDLGMTADLLAEATAIASAPGQAEMFKAIEAFENVDPHPDKHPRTEVQVDVRYQFAPSDLVARLRAHGFRPVTLYPVHFHCLPPAVKAENPQIHSAVASAMMEAPYLRDHRIVPQSSTYVLEVRKS